MTELLRPCACRGLRWPSETSYRGDICYYCNHPTWSPWGFVSMLKSDPQFRKNHPVAKAIAEQFPDQLKALLEGNQPVFPYDMRAARND
jgi:hypothetical protein